MGLCHLQSKSVRVRVFFNCYVQALLRLDNYVALEYSGVNFTPFGTFENSQMKCEIIIG